MRRSAADPSLHPRRARRAAALAAAVATVAGTAVTAAATAATAAPATAGTLAPAIGSAARGGAVIVWLKDQHSNLNLRTQGAQRTADAHADQKPLVAAIKAAGGTDILQLVSLNAVAAHVSAAEVKKLQARADVKQILPDGTYSIGDRAPVGALTHAKVVPARSIAGKAAAAGKRANSTVSPAATTANPFPTANNCGTSANPLIEPEALTDINAPAMTDNGLTTEPGHGVVVANDGISIPFSSHGNGDIVGNPNFVRPAADGGASVVIGATPGDTTDASDGEYYGDASSIAAQGTVVYDYAQELPYSGLPAATCYFKLVGDAPGASLVDTGNIDTPESAAGDPASRGTITESRIIAGIDAAVIKSHADVINESYGYANSPGSYASRYAANDAAVASGVTVVVSSGDSGDSGTVSSPATDPLVIAAGATNTLRLNAMAYGYTGWVNDDITPLSSGGTSPNNKVVDLVAPGYGGEAACNPDGSDCPTNTQTEAFGGTSEAAPLVAGAAADVIQAYRDSHNGASPSPALVKQFLTGTAKDVDAPADQQGAGLVNIGAAVSAAQQYVNTTAPNTSKSLVPSPTQLDLTGNGGSTSFQSVGITNDSTASTTVTATYRTLGAEQPIGSTVTENVSAPDPTLPVPNDGAQAAPDISFTVPAGLDRLDADMIWPDAANGTILNFILTDPSGRLRQISYDYGSPAASSSTAGTVPDIQHVEVASPEAGTWKAQIKWGNGRSHLQEAPNVPGTYTGTVSFRVAGQNYVTTPATSAPVTIGARATVNVPLQVAFPTAPGDHPQSVQFTAANGAVTSVPIARRTLVPSNGGEFDTAITSTVGRGIGQISTFDVNVPSGRPDLGVTVATPDVSADDPMSLYLVNPNGTSVATHTTVNGGRTRTVNGVLLAVKTINGVPMQTVTFHVANPMPGTWEIDTALNLTTSGKEFTQTIVGDVLPQAPVITSPAAGSYASTQTPAISGTGAPGDQVTVSDAAGPVCTATVDSTGAWTCTPTAPLPAGQVTVTATQADSTGFPSNASAGVTFNVPAMAAVTLSVNPVAPGVNQAVTLIAGTTNVPDGTTATFSDGTTVLGTATVNGRTASLTLPSGLAPGNHPLTASVPLTQTSTAATSPEVDVMIDKFASSVVLTLSKSSAPYGTAVTGSIQVEGATGGTATVKIDSAMSTVTIDSAGKGTFAIPGTLQPGAHTIAATYNGNGTVAPSSTATAPLTITKAASTTAVTLKSTAVKHGATVAMTISVGGAKGSMLPPSGYITVSIRISGRTTTRKVYLWQVNKGTTPSFTVATPGVTGSASVTASYAGDTRYAASNSPAKSLKLT